MEIMELTPFSFITDPLSNVVRTLSAVVLICSIMIIGCVTFKILRVTGLLNNLGVPKWLKKQEATDCEVTLEDGFAVRKNGVWKEHKGMHLVGNEFTARIPWRKMVLASGVILLCPPGCDAFTHEEIKPALVINLVMLLITIMFKSKLPKIIFLIMFATQEVKSLFVTQSMSQIVVGSNGLKEVGLSWKRPNADDFNFFAGNGLYFKDIDLITPLNMPAKSSRTIDVESLAFSKQCYSCPGWAIGKLVRTSFCCDPSSTTGDITPRCHSNLSNSSSDIKPCPMVWPSSLLLKSGPDGVILPLDDVMSVISKSSGIQLVSNQTSCRTSDCIIYPGLAERRDFNLMAFNDLSIMEKMIGITSLWKVVRLNVSETVRVKRETVKCQGWGWVGVWNSINCDDEPFKVLIKSELARKMEEVYGKLKTVTNKQIDWADGYFKQVKLMSESITNITRKVNANFQLLEQSFADQAEVLNDISLSFNSFPHFNAAFHHLQQLSSLIMRTMDKNEEAKMALMENLRLDAKLINERERCVQGKRCETAFSILCSHFPEVKTSVEAGWEGQMTVSMDSKFMNVSMRIPNSVQITTSLVPFEPEINFKSGCKNNYCSCCVMQSYKAFKPDYSSGFAIPDMEALPHDFFDNQTSQCMGKPTGAFRLMTSSNCIMLDFDSSCSFRPEACKELLRFGDRPPAFNITYVSIASPSEPVSSKLTREAPIVINETVTFNYTAPWQLKEDVEGILSEHTNGLSQLNYHAQSSDQHLTALMIAVILLSVINGIQLSGRLFRMIKKIRSENVFEKGIYALEAGQIRLLTREVKHYKIQWSVTSHNLVVEFCDVRTARQADFLENLGMTHTYLNSKICDCSELGLARLISAPTRPVLLKVEESPVIQRKATAPLKEELKFQAIPKFGYEPQSQKLLLKKETDRDKEKKDKDHDSDASF